LQFVPLGGEVPRCRFAVLLLETLPQNNDEDAEGRDFLDLAGLLEVLRSLEFPFAGKYG
jgi:hypothetical protein